MPEVSRFYGIVVYMFFGDHNPPHFHAKYQSYEVKINIDDGMVQGKIPRRALKLIYEWLDLHKTELIDNWKLLEQRKPINKIDPLK